MRRVEIFEPYTIRDPQTDEYVFELKFQDLWARIMQHPGWLASMRNGIAQHAINAAIKAALTAGEMSFLIEDADWDIACELISAPRTCVPVRLPSGEVVIEDRPTFGYFPQYAGQVAMLLKTTWLDAKAV